MRRRIDKSFTAEAQGTQWERESGINVAKRCTAGEAPYSSHAIVDAIHRVCCIAIINQKTRC